MANKDKILAAAQKHLQKNNIARAIKEYRKLLEIDPKDVRSRQKLAELYSRSGKVDDALQEYETVAGYYADNTFYLKAIAVYKQMQKLAPQNTAYTLKLAKLNEQQGLIGNALSEYRALLNHYQSISDHDEAIKVLNHMQELDPENITIGMRIAEFYASNGKQDLADEEYRKVEQRVRELGNYKQLQKFYQHFMTAWPENIMVQVGYGRAMVEYGEPLGGVQYLTKLQRQHPKDTEVLSALAVGFHHCSEFGHELECLARLVEWQPEQIDFWLRLFQAAMSTENYEQGFEWLEQGKELFFTAERVAELKPFYEQLREVLPENKEVLTSLHAIYEHLGEGEKLFDVLSDGLVGEEVGYETSGADDFDAISFEAPMDSVATVSEPAADVNDDLEFEELEFDIVQDSASAQTDETSFDDLTFDVVEETMESNVAVDPFAAAASSAAPIDLQSDLEEADFYLQQGLLDEAEQVCRRLDQACPNNGEVQQRLQSIAERRGDGFTQPVGMSSAEEVESDQVSVEISSDAFDLDLDLDLNIDSAFSAPSQPLDLNDAEDDIDSSLELSFGGAQSDSLPLDSLADSQRGVQTVIGDEDTESAFNLGVAYKEMGLFDDAVVEFNKAMQSPARKIDSLSLKAACFIDQQRFDEAEEVLTVGLSDSALTVQERVVLYYETGLLYEAWHRYADALSSYQVVADNDISFRNVSVKISELKELVEDSDTSSGSQRVSYL